jgi:hypothetical protein
LFWFCVTRLGPNLQIDDEDDSSTRQIVHTVTNVAIVLTL